ncbi:MAG TPA: carbohydrate ABC transporter permease [Thermotogota bacterium]|nr:carbohydrate ABC transporter permease [Thermotogota bacterium]
MVMNDFEVRRKKIKPKKLFLTILKYTVLLIGAFCMVLPFFWMISASLMTPEELISDTPRWLPEVPQWQNYLEVPKRVPILKYYKNSLITAGISTLLVLLTSSLAGYAFAKIKFRGRRQLFRLVLATMMFPVFIFLIPNFYLMKQLGWISNYLSLIVPFAVSGYGIFLIRQFVMSIPDDLIDSARIDGAGELKIYWRIILPIIKPAMATLATLTFISMWNSFLWPLIVTSSFPELMTLPVGVSRLSLSFSSAENQHLIVTGLVYQVVPMVVLFLYLQKNYIKGFMLSGFGDL